MTATYPRGVAGEGGDQGDPNQHELPTLRGRASGLGFAVNWLLRAVMTATYPAASITTDRRAGALGPRRYRRR
jgi:hypothetical protein